MNDEDKKLILMIDADDLKNIFADEAKKIILELKQADTKEDTPRWINSKEVCKLLGISKSTLVNYRKRNEITAHKLQGKLLFDYAEISSKINKIKQFESVSNLVHLNE